MKRTDKRAMVARLIADLQHEIDVVLAAAQDAHAGATHAEARPENDKDTRALEASYLAGAQAERVRELRAALAGLAALPLRDFDPGEPIASGALVRVEVGGARQRFFVAPHGGGLETEIDGATVRVVTPQSPLGRALVGRRAGDVVEVETQRALREYEVTEVA